MKGGHHGIRKAKSMRRHMAFKSSGVSSVGVLYNVAKNTPGFYKKVFELQREAFLKKT